MKLLDITSANFKQEVEDATVPVILDFWAAWCPPCKALSPILSDLAKKYAGAIKVVKIDTEAEPELALQFNVTALPTLCALVKGRVVAQEIGFGGKAKLSAMFERLVKQS